VRLLALFFSPRGRIDRSTYWATGAVLFGFAMIVMAATLGRAWLDMPRGPDVTDLEQGAFLRARTLESPLFWIPVLILAWSSTALKIKRWHDLGRSGFAIFTEQIPVVGEWIAFKRTGFDAGTRGANAYGPDPAFSGQDAPRPPAPRAPPPRSPASPRRSFGRRGA